MSHIDDAPGPTGPGTESTSKSRYTIPSGKRLHNYGKSPCFMGKLTINGDFP